MTTTATLTATAEMHRLAEVYAMATHGRHAALDMHDMIDEYASQIDLALYGRETTLSDEQVAHIEPLTEISGTRGYIAACQVTMAGLREQAREYERKIASTYEQMWQAARAHGWADEDIPATAAELALAIDLAPTC